jgi:hypothetical protein
MPATQLRDACSSRSSRVYAAVDFASVIILSTSARVNHADRMLDEMKPVAVARDDQLDVRALHHAVGAGGPVRTTDRVFADRHPRVGVHLLAGEGLHGDIVRGRHHPDGAVDGDREW